jgi:HNH endonuclease
MSKKSIPIRNLIDAYERLGSVPDVARLFNRTVSTVWSRLNKAAALKQRKWSSAHDNILREGYHTASENGTIAALANALGRTVSALHSRANVLGITRRARKRLALGPWKYVTLEHAKSIAEDFESTDLSFRRFCKDRCYNDDVLSISMKRYFGAWWNDLVKAQRKKARPRLRCSKEDAIARTKKRRLEKPDVVRESDREYRKANSIRLNKNNREWKRKNADKVRVTNLNRLARKKSANGSHTPEEIKDLMNKQDGRCAHAWCRVRIRKRYHADHIIPLALNGGNGIKNIQLLCVPCNLSKNASHPIDFAQRHGMLL